MNEMRPLRVGWCPAAYRPMQSGDGLIVRIKPRAGTLSKTQLLAIADAAETCGNGGVDITRRANLQIRGITDVTFPAALQILDNAGLLDADPAVDAIRNILVDPLSGLDPALADARPLATTLENVLIATKELHRLAGKFGFAVLAHGVDMTADITMSLANGVDVEISLSGAPNRSAHVPPDRAVDFALKLAIVSLELVPDGRMRDVVAKFGAESIFYRAGLAAGDRNVSSAKPPIHIGLLARDNQPFAVGVQPTFGRANASSLREFALAIEHDIRVSPQRALLTPVRDASEAEHVFMLCQKLGWITASDDPRRKIDACTGSPGCARATLDTRADATLLAKEFLSHHGDIHSLHISGCEKGCARSSSANYTLVGSGGAYSIVVNGDVRAIPVLQHITQHQLIPHLCKLHGACRAECP